MNIFVYYELTRSKSFYEVTWSGKCQASYTNRTYIVIAKWLFHFFARSKESEVYESCNGDTGYNRIAERGDQLEWEEKQYPD